MQKVQNKPATEIDFVPGEDELTLIFNDQQCLITAKQLDALLKHLASGENLRFANCVVATISDGSTVLAVGNRYLLLSESDCKDISHSLRRVFAEFN